MKNSRKYRKRRIRIDRVIGVVLSICMILANIGISLTESITRRDADGQNGVVTAMAEDAVYTTHEAHAVCCGTEYYIAKEDDTKHDSSNCTHDGAAVQWTAWGSGTDENTSLPAAGGYYYLTDDVTLTGVWEPANDTVLCLNGHMVSGSVTDKLINVGNAVTFTLTDCRDYSGRDTSDKIYNDKSTAIYISKGGVFNFYGGKITGIIPTGAGKGGGGIFIKDGELNMYGGMITECEANYNSYSTSRTGQGGGVYQDGTFNLYGGSIENNTATFGAGVCIVSGLFTMYGGKISGNASKNSGGGIYTYSWTYSQADYSYRFSSSIWRGEISNNSARLYGGGIYVNNSAYFDIFGGEIKSNIAGTGVSEGEGSGGGLYAEGSVYMYGGSIEGNSARSGGGVCIVGGGRGSLELMEGSIINNHASDSGGGVFAGGVFRMQSSESMNAYNIQYSGGTIQGNDATYYGGGVYVASYFGISVGVITGNSVGETGNGGGLYLANEKPYTCYYISGGQIIDNFRNASSGNVNDNLYCDNKVYDESKYNYGYFEISGSLPSDTRIGIMVSRLPQSADDTTVYVAQSNYSNTKYYIQSTDLEENGNQKLFADDSDNYYLEYDGDNEQILLRLIDNTPAAEPYSFEVDITSDDEDLKTIMSVDSDNVEAAIVADDEKVEGNKVAAEFVVNSNVLDESDKSLIASAMAADEYKDIQSSEILASYDITLSKTVDTSSVAGTPTEINSVTSGKSITINIKLSDAAKTSVSEGVTDNSSYRYYVARIHDDNGSKSASLLEAKLSTDGEYITFETDRFSTYSVIYASMRGSDEDNADKDKNLGTDDTVQTSTEAITETSKEKSTEAEQTTDETTTAAATTEAVKDSTTAAQTTTAVKATTKETTATESTAATQKTTEETTTAVKVTTKETTATESTVAAQKTTSQVTQTTAGTAASSNGNIKVEKVIPTAGYVAADQSGYNGLNKSDTAADTSVKKDTALNTNQSTLDGSNENMNLMVKSNSAVSNVSSYASQVTQNNGKDAEPTTGDLTEVKPLLFARLGMIAAIIYLSAIVLEEMSKRKKCNRG